MDMKLYLQSAGRQVALAFLHFPIGYECLIFFSTQIGFLLASSGGWRSLLYQLQKDKLHWN
jgi:hypothetical protein